MDKQIDGQQVVKLMEWAKLAELDFDDSALRLQVINDVMGAMDPRKLTEPVKEVSEKTVG